jgi:ENTS family enterobactin (siderophore) exporter
MSRLVIDVRPLRQSRDLRLLYGGRAVSQLGSVITLVAASLQVYDLTHSSLAVGGISVAEAVPMVIGMLIGGVLADACDRRRLILVTQAVAGAAIAGLAINTGVGQPRLWLIYIFIAVSGAALGLGGPARSAAVPTLVSQDLVPAAVAISSTIIQAGALVGPAIAGLVIAGFGFAAGYSADAASFLIYIFAASRMRPLPPESRHEHAGRRSFTDGLRYVRHHGLVAGILLIDINAMVFGMPRALFPAVATGTFHGGPALVGVFYAAPAAGAIVAAATSGWTGQIRRVGPVLLISVIVWGVAIAAFGLVPLLGVAIVLLAVAGAADLVSAILRGSLLQLSVPDPMRGRLNALWLAQAQSAPAAGNLEAGAVAAISTPAISIVSGGIACVIGATLLALLFPALRRAKLEAYRNDDNVREAAEAQVQEIYDERHSNKHDEPVTAGRIRDE